MTAIKMYKRFMETGEMDREGLCSQLHNAKYAEDLKIFKPEFITSLYWAYGEESGNPRYTFTPLRQTILLLIAAINNEL